MTPAVESPPVTTTPETSAEPSKLTKDTYRGLLDPGDVEAYPLPDPEPEERARYWEFREVARP